MYFWATAVGLLGGFCTGLEKGFLGIGVGMWFSRGSGGFGEGGWGRIWGWTIGDYDLDFGVHGEVPENLYNFCKVFLEFDNFSDGLTELGFKGFFGINSSMDKHVTYVGIVDQRCPKAAPTIQASAIRKTNW